MDASGLPAATAADRRSAASSGGEATAADVLGPVDAVAAPVAAPRTERPSIIDRLLSAIDAAPVPAPVVYAVLAGALLAIEVAVKVLDATVGSVHLIHPLLPLLAMATLPILHLFRDSADRALAAARPLLTLDAAGYAAWRAQLTTLPARGTLLAAAGGLISLSLLTALQPPETFRVLGIMTSPLAAAVEWTLQALTWSGVGIVAYTVLRQMRAVYDLTTRHLRIELFAPGPLYAFSRLTALHAVVTTGIVATSSLALAGLAATPQWLVFGGGPLVLAVVAFVAPLWGIHRRLRAERRHQLDGTGRQLQGLLDELSGRVEGDRLDGIEGLKNALDAMIVARGEIGAVSTWPWQRSTLRGVATVMLAPVAVWALTRIAERFVP